METINSDDINDLDYKQISIITLKNGNIITIDDTIPSTKSSKLAKKRNTFSSYQISQKLINLTIIGKKEITNNNDFNFNDKNKICKNINFLYNSIKNEQKENIINKKNNDLLKQDNMKEKMKNFCFDDFKCNDIGNNEIKNENLKLDLNKEEIEKIQFVEMDLDAKSNNEFKILINEFDNKKEKKVKSSKRNNKNNLLLSNNILSREPKTFDLSEHFNFLVNKFKNKVKDVKKGKYNKRYYEIYKGIANKNIKNDLFKKSTFNMYNHTGNIIAKTNKFLTSSSVIKNKNSDFLLKNSNIKTLKAKIFKKNSSFEPKLFRTLYIGSQIILPSNVLN